MFARMALVGLFALVGAGPALAELIVSVGSSAASAGNTVSVDVFVTSPDRLDFFVGEFVITPVGSAPASGLRFAAPQPYPPLTDPSYAFFGNSYSESQLPLNPGGVNPAGNYTVGDVTLNNLGVDVSTPRLLARLTLTADGSLLGGPHAYTIGLNPAGSQFQDPAFGDLTFNGMNGTITVSGGAGGQPVPEPGSLLVLVLVVTGLAAWLRSRGNAVP